MTKWPSTKMHIQNRFIHLCGQLRHHRLLKIEGESFFYSDAHCHPVLQPIKGELLTFVSIWCQSLHLLFIYYN